MHTRQVRFLFDNEQSFNMLFNNLKKILEQRTYKLGLCLKSFYSFRLCLLYTTRVGIKALIATLILDWSNWSNKRFFAHEEYSNFSNNINNTKKPSTLEK